MPEASATGRTSDHDCDAHVDNQGLCHTCGRLVNEDWYRIYAGDHALEERRRETEAWDRLGIDARDLRETRPPAGPWEA